MPRYIDADFLINRYKNLAEDSWNKKACPGSWADAFQTVIDDVESLPTADVVEVPKEGIGELSDGYHTFNELYHHRAILFSVICNLMPDKAWKSKLHDTGDMFDGMSFDHQKKAEKQCELMETTILALGKQLPEKPKIVETEVMPVCPRCGDLCSTSQKYCRYCGQKLDWGDTDDR